jgi:NAD(P)-dependent dehydrogenase (short-subunit alcohol dehydrogenase family)
MAGWERVLAVDLVGTALFVEALRPHVTSGTALVCFASMAPYLDPSEPNPAAEAVLDQPFAADLVARLHATVGESLEDPSMATCGPSGESIAWYDAKPSRSAHEVRASARSRPVSSTRRWDGKKSRRDR